MCKEYETNDANKVKRCFACSACPVSWSVEVRPRVESPRLTVARGKSGQAQIDKVLTIVVVGVGMIAAVV